MTSENSENEKSISDLTSLLMTARDLEIGLRNELRQAQLEKIDIESSLTQRYESSLTWRAGRVVLFPLRLLGFKRN